MGKVRRVYVEKKPQFAVSAKSLLSEIGSYLGIKDVTGVRVLIRYDVQDVSDNVFKKAVKTVFSEPPVDVVYEETFPRVKEEHARWLYTAVTRAQDKVVLLR